MVIVTMATYFFVMNV